MNPATPLPSGIVTALFTDIVDSTKLKPRMKANTTALRDEAYRSTVRAPHDTRLFGIVARYRGTKVNPTGDGYLFAFRDAEDAVLCGLDIQESLRTDPIDTPLGPLRLRVGIHTGAAEPADGDYNATTIDKAARVLGVADPGDVCISSETRAMVGELRGVTFEETTKELKGIGPAHLFRVCRPAPLPGSEPDTQRSARRLAEMENPYDFATTANSRTFKGRALEAAELLDSIESGTHTVIFGLQRMGKTSLIEHGIKAELQSRPSSRDAILIATIDMQRLGGANVKYRDFVHAIVEAIVGRLAALGLGREVQNLRSLTHELFTPGNYQRGDTVEFFATLARLLQGVATVSRRRIVLFIDEFSEIRNVIERNKQTLHRNPSRMASLLPHDMYIDVPFIHHLSSLLRDDALKRQLTFIVLARPFLAEYDQREGLQILKLMKPIMLRYLDEKAAKELITEPLESCVTFEEGAVNALFTLTAGHPYLLQFILKLIVDRIKRENRPIITLADVTDVKERMVSDGPAFDAQFAVLISDYSVDEITMRQEARLGEGLLALVSKLGQQPERWVTEPDIFRALERQNIPKDKTASLLSQLIRTCILEESSDEEHLRYRLSIPLVQDRFVRQNLYQKYFGRA